MVTFFGRFSMSTLNFCQNKFMQDEEKIMKHVSKPTFKNVTSYDD